MSIGVVVPVYNRRENLELFLLSLEQQTRSDFVVVIADDGSTDGTREMVERRSKSFAWQSKLYWIGCGPSQGVRTGRARNLGAANLPSDTSLLLMMDSDLVLQPTSIELFADVSRQHPGVVVLGVVEWLPPLKREEISREIIAREIASLRRAVPEGVPTRVEGTFVGKELRTGLFDLSPDRPIGFRPEWALPLNSAWPLSLYWSIDGFDEGMKGYGYQDMEFGARAVSQGVTCIPRPDLWALHVWHSKPAKAMEENQRNLDLYLRRHGPNRVIETDVDWSLWFHYHSERGGRLARTNDQLWAISGLGNHRLSLPDTSWIARLGHCEHSVQLLDEAEFANVVDRGTAHE